MNSPTTDVRRPPEARPIWQSLLLSFAVALAISVAVLLLMALVLQRSNIITSTLTSPVAIAIIVGAIAVSVGLRFGVTRLTGSALAGRLAQLVPVLLVAWFVIVPLVRETTVDEALPTAAVAAEQSALPGASAPSAGGVPAAPAAPAAPVERGRGTFKPLDHTVSGSAALFDLGQGSRTVRFENFTVQPGPDYVVWVVPGRDAKRPGGGAELGGLKGTKGSQNYALPAQFSSSGPVTVLIWCRAFQVPVAHATIG